MLDPIKKYMNINIKKNKLLILSIFLILISFFIGRFSGNHENIIFYKKIKGHNNKFKLISPFLDYEISGYISKELKNFKYKILDYIDHLKEKNPAITVSLYFRDLNNGPWFGINENENFSPASLFKVPYMITFLKQAEDTPALLMKKVKYEKPNSTFLPSINSSQALELGRYYTFDELLFQMIAYSDNEALALILPFINEKILMEFYSDLGIDISKLESDEDFVNIKEYASFFRILYNASYLNKEMSEKALFYLTQSAFKNGIAAGIPSNITIAHKFGEREIYSKNIIQLHECGIVYYPTHPYLLCVMTRGNDMRELIKIIKEISTLVYTEIHKQRNNYSR